MVTKDRWMELQNTLGHQVPRKGSLSPRRRGLNDCEESPAAAENADDRFRSRLRAAYLVGILPFECARRGRSKRDELLSAKTLHL